MTIYSGYLFLFIYKSEFKLVIASLVLYQTWIRGCKIALSDLGNTGCDRVVVAESCRLWADSDSVIS